MPKRNEDKKDWSIYYLALDEFADEIMQRKRKSFKLKDFYDKLTTKSCNEIKPSVIRSFLNKMIERGSVIRRIHGKGDTSYVSLRMVLTENDRLMGLWNSPEREKPIKIIQLAKQYNSFFRRIPDINLLRSILNDLCFNGYGVFNPNDDTITIKKPINSLEFFNLFKKEFPPMNVSKWKKKRSMLPPVNVPLKEQSPITQGASMPENSKTIHKDSEIQVILVGDMKVMQGDEPLLAIKQSDLKKVYEKSQELIQTKKDLAEALDNIKHLEAEHRTKQIPLANMSFLYS